MAAERLDEAAVDRWVEELMEAAIKADALPLDGHDIRMPDSLARKRRVTQRTVIRQLWARLFPADTLPDYQADKWLRTITDDTGNDGMECELLTDLVYRVVREAPHDSTAIRSPRQFVTVSLMNITDPLWTAKREALRQRRVQPAQAQLADPVAAPEAAQAPTLEDCYHSLPDVQRLPDGTYTSRRCGTTGLAEADVMPF